jgi:ferredoxin
MAYVITAACVDHRNGACAFVCPSNCITCDLERDRMMFVDPLVCIDCRGCVASCPTDAIRAPFEMRPGDAPYAEVNRLWYEDRDAARRMLDAIAPRRDARAAASA